MTTIEFKNTNNEDLIFMCKQHPDISIFHELFCRHVKSDIPREFSGRFVRLLDQINLIPTLLYKAELLYESELEPELLISSIADIALVGLRAMFLEKHEQNQHNYTIQNCLKVAGYEQEVTKIDSILDDVLFTQMPENLNSFRKHLKNVTNWSIAHLDGKKNENVDLKEFLDRRYLLFTNPNYHFMVTTIMAKAHAVYQKAVISYIEDNFPELSTCAKKLRNDVEQYETSFLGDS